MRIYERVYGVHAIQALVLILESFCFFSLHFYPIYYNNKYSISEFLSRSSMQTFLHCLLIFLINNHHSFYLVILHCIQHEHHQESGLDSFTHFVIWSAAIDYSKSFVSTYIKYIVADSSKLWSKSLLGSCPTAICRWTNKQTNTTHY